LTRLKAYDKPLAGSGGNDWPSIRFMSGQL